MAAHSGDTNSCGDTYTHLLQQANLAPSQAHRAKSETDCLSRRTVAAGCASPTGLC